MFCNLQKGSSGTYIMTRNKIKMGKTSLGSYSLLVSEMKMNGQDSYSRWEPNLNSYDWGTNKERKVDSFSQCKFSPFCETEKLS